MLTRSRLGSLYANFFANIQYIYDPWLLSKCVLVGQQVLFFLILGEIPEVHVWDKYNKT